MMRIWLSRVLLCTGLFLGVFHQTADADEPVQINVNDLGYIDYLAVAIRLGADPGALVEQMPLDQTLSPFEARRLRSALIEDAIASAQAHPANTAQISLAIDSYLILLNYDFGRQTYMLCLPQGIYIEKHYPETGEAYPKTPSVRFMALSTVSSCADQQSLAQINQSEENRFTFGLYLPLAMKQSTAEAVYNAAGGEFAARRVRYNCRNLTLTRENNIICGKIDFGVNLKGHELTLDISTTGYGQPQARWTWQ